MLILFILISCAQKTKEKPLVVNKALDTVEIVEDSSKKVDNSSFKKIIGELKVKSVPLIDSTNFDTFIEEPKLCNNEEAGLLQLEKLYPNFYKEGYNYRATPNYKIQLSGDFHSVVVTVFKGDHEMESVLINYDLKGKLIDSKVISYDEIAESMFKIESRIEQDKLTINSIADLEEKSVTIEMFKIDDDGTLKAIASTTTNNDSSDLSLIENAIQQLGLEKLKIHKDLVTSKVQPNNNNETIVVIPEIVIEDEDYFELNSHIVLVNNTTQKITHKYFESSKTNNLVSDAVKLANIEIDTAPYILAGDERAFGVRVYHYNNSKPNPYSNKTLSLFMKSGDSLKKVLHNYDVMNYGGEWDTACAGEFIDIKNTLIIAEEKTNGYFDILIKSKVTETKNEKDEKGECQSTKNSTTETKILKYNGKIYKEVK